MEEEQAQTTLHRPYISHLTGAGDRRWSWIFCEQRAGCRVSRLQEGASILLATPGLPHLSERVGEPRKGRSSMSDSQHLPGSRLALPRQHCNSPAAKNVVFWRERRQRRWKE